MEIPGQDAVEVHLSVVRAGVRQHARTSLRGVRHMVCGMCSSIQLSPHSALTANNPATNSTSTRTTTYPTTCISTCTSARRGEDIGQVGRGHVDGGALGVAAVVSFRGVRRRHEHRGLGLRLRQAVGVSGRVVERGQHGVGLHETQGPQRDALNWRTRFENL